MISEASPEIGGLVNVSVPLCEVSNLNENVFIQGWKKKDRVYRKRMLCSEINETVSLPPPLPSVYLTFDVALWTEKSKEKHFFLLTGPPCADRTNRIEP